MTDWAAYKAAERRAAAELAAAWRVDLVETDDFCAIDWIAIRDGRVVGVAEFKDRTVGPNPYPSTMIDPFLFNLDKVVPLRAAAEFFAVPGVLVSKCSDGTFWFDVMNLPRPFPTVEHGRRDRDPARFPNDYGLRVPIPVSACSLVTTNERGLL